MIQPINKNILTLGVKAEKATPLDTSVIADLKDTLAAHTSECVGMAANMIGKNKSIIIVSLGISSMVMINPVIVKKTGAFETEEGCLSLEGTRKVTRYKSIVVEFEDESFKKQKRSFSGFTAQIIQHETDHCSGVII